MIALPNSYFIVKPVTTGGEVTTIGAPLHAHGMDFIVRTTLKQRESVVSAHAAKVVEICIHFIANVALEARGDVGEDKLPRDVTL